MNEKTPTQKSISLWIAGGVLSLILIAGGALAFFRHREVRALDAGYAALARQEPAAAQAAFDEAHTQVPAWLQRYPISTTLGYARAAVHAGDLPAAGAALDALLNEQPDVVPAHLLRGDVYLAQNAYTAAYAAYTAAQEQVPESPTSYLRRGWAHLYARQDADARAAFEEALALEPAAPGAHVGLGIIALFDHATAEAEAAAEVALQAASDPTLANALRGAALVGAGETQAGGALLNRAVAEAPDAVTLQRALYLRARARLEAGRLTAALNDADRLVDLAPTWTWSYLLRGDVQLARESYPQAQADYQQAVDLAPEQGLPYVGRARYYEAAGDTEVARVDVERALNTLPDHVPALVLHARLLAADGSVERALADLDHAINVAPHYVPAYAERAALHVRQERWTAARDDYDVVLQVAPENLSALTARARVHLALEEPGSALEDLNAALQQVPGDLELRKLRAQAYLALDNLTLAYRDAQRVLEQDETWAPAHLIKGLYLREEEAYFQAVVALSNAIDHDPELARAYAARARAHFELNDPDRARADAQRALELSTELPHAYAARALYYVYEREWEPALDDADRAVTLAPEDKELRATRGSIYLEGGDARRALDDFNAALELDADWAEGQLLRATALDALQRYADAVSALETLLNATTDVTYVEIAESSIADLERIPEEVDGLHTWADSYHGFQVTYPAGWRQYVDPGESLPLMLLGPRDKDYRASVLLTITDLDFSTTARQLARMQRTRSFPDYELVSERALTVDGRTGLRRVFTWTATDHRLREISVTVHQFYLVVDRRAIVFTATARSVDAEKYTPTFDQIIESLTVN